MKKEKILVIDLETTGLDPFTHRIKSIALCCEKRKGFNVVLHSNKNKAKEFLKPLLPIFEDESITKVFHNAKFDLKFLYEYGIEIKGEIIDTMILAHLDNPNRKTNGLKELSEIYLGYKQVTYKKMLKERTIDEVPLEELTQYACEDADQTFQLYKLLNEKLKTQYP